MIEETEITSVTKSYRVDLPTFDLLRQLANTVTDGNKSKMIRLLIRDGAKQRGIIPGDGSKAA